MSRTCGSERIDHPALDTISGPLASLARLSDRGRLAVLMQGAAVLSHLEVAGWHLADGWRGLRLDRAGLVRGLHAVPGRAADPASVSLERLLERLFGSLERLLGKGEAKQLALTWWRRWRRLARSLPANRIVIEILDQATFLWQPGWSVARAALVARLEWPGKGELVVAGRGGFESRLLQEASDLQQTRALLESTRAGDLWLQLQRRRAGTLAGGADGSAADNHTWSLQNRRRWCRSLAAKRWQKKAEQRAARGDLARAAAACLHALRLAGRADADLGVAVSLLAAEIDLRRGCPARLAALLEEAALFAGGLPETAGVKLGELGVRQDLLRGRPAAALRHLQAMDREGSGSGDEWTQTRRVLSARALGWLGRGAEARESLTGLEEKSIDALDGEEVPALWAFAGDWIRAREAAAADAVGELWRLGLAGEPIPVERWRALVDLEPYRAARLVFDFEMLMPGKAPPHWIARGAETLRGVGAEAFADRLHRGQEGGWRALARYLEAGTGRAAELGELFHTSGYFDVRLEWTERASKSILVPGHGGENTLTASRGSGDLILSASRIDPTLRALFALAVRDYRPETNGRRATSRLAGIVGTSAELQQALSRLERLAATDIAVLIRGETGTGKELAARLVHRISSRSGGQWLAINCAALSESLLLSDLYGHVRGAFTGADRDRAGVFETADGGTVLLDEIGDLPWTAQGKLLRVLQEGEVRRLGESQPRRVDVRILAATHRDLERMVEAGEFRADLFYRLKVGSVLLPPLRERGQDVLLLAEHFLSRWNGRLTRRARRQLLSYDWPGNVRELRNVLQLAVALSDGGLVDTAALELPGPSSSRKSSYHAQVDRLRLQLVQEALQASRGSQARAARQLGLSRQALSYLVRKFELRS